MNRCVSLCLAKSIALTELREHLAPRHTCAIHRDALHIDTGAGHAFAFNYGVLVLWGFEDQGAAALRREIAGYCVEPHDTPSTDEFTFETSAARTRIHGDHIALTEPAPLSLLAVSHGLAQSSKLDEFESYALKAIEESAHIPLNMANTGRARLPRKTIARMRGRLFLVESDINLNYALLDTPEFFWEYPELEDIYITTARYLDVQPRTELLNRKLNIIHELFGMLADEQKHKHSSMLEWIIIWLIAFEIAIFVLHDYLKII